MPSQTPKGSPNTMMAATIVASGPNHTEDRDQLRPDPSNGDIDEEAGQQGTEKRQNDRDEPNLTRQSQGFDHAAQITTGNQKMDHQRGGGAYHGQTGKQLRPIRSTNPFAISWNSVNNATQSKISPIPSQKLSDCAISPPTKITTRPE